MSISQSVVFDGWMAQAQTWDDTHDCVRNGRDVFKALAMGATAVMPGRSYVWGLASAGAKVAHVLRLLRDELEMSMALTGCARLELIDRGKIFQAAR